MSTRDISITVENERWFICHSNTVKIRDSAPPPPSMVGPLQIGPPISYLNKVSMDKPPPSEDTLSRLYAHLKDLMITNSNGWVLFYHETFNHIKVSVLL